MSKRVFCTLLCAVALAYSQPAPDVSLPPEAGWTLIVGPHSLSAGTGSEVSSGNITLTVTGKGNPHTPNRWCVDASRADETAWPGALALSISWVGASDSQAITGGLQSGTYLTLDALLDQLFIEGELSGRETLEIYLRYRLSGLSLDLAPGDYPTDIIFTSRSC